MVVFVHHGSRAGKLNARTDRRPFAFFVLVASSLGVFLFAVVAYVLNHTNIVGLAINAGLVGLGIWAIVTWPHDSGAWFIAFCAFAIGGFNLYSMLSE
ncbi:hypothetical protein [Bradyrhizobium sp. 172]|uniref:hypothetical protein n=1 Tax=Bradyrhizobium sp. 172 TaxID=2782643 RepID=UPI0020003322|nr:hypothetical protein [Bradyrhizobium sp. 172]UPJ94843.1 hypothetical protein IVB07_31160 [Bradyrhizobium sp. 172]